MFAFIFKAGKLRLTALVALLVLLSAIMDWAVGNTVSLGLLYILPMMISAVALPWQGSLALALLCGLLRSRFDVPSSPAEAVLRFLFASLAYFTSSLLAAALIRNRQMAVEHGTRIQKEQERRAEAEQQLRALVESSPAGILTLDENGVVLAANTAAGTLFAVPPGHALRGQAIVDYLPVLADALRLETGPEGYRTAAQCQGRRANGEIFLAHTWFSSYDTPEGRRLAAVVVDSSEEMRDREEQNLRLLQESNRLTAAAVSHELRNLCSAITLVVANLESRHGWGPDEDFQRLSTLVKGIETMANLELRASRRTTPELEGISLRQVLDDLRILIECEWTEMNGTVRWRVPPDLPRVISDPPGLLQALLNLAQNSHRAVQSCQRRELDVTVSISDGSVRIALQDTGPGVNAPEQLFQPFQVAADGVGLGLYVSRALIRSYGGDIRFEAQPSGACFVVELPTV